MVHKMNKIAKMSGILSIGILLAACQDSTSADSTEEPAEEQTEENATTPSSVAIEGLAHHYHTGDEIELTAVTDTETNENNWQWYMKDAEASDWSPIAGLNSDTFSREATESGVQIKAELLDSSDELLVESEAVEVEIDDHGANDEVGRRIYNGFFYSAEVGDRPLSDWAGDWQSVYPYLESGALDEVFEAKADKSGSMNAQEYKEYYTEGYITDVDRMVIDEDSFTFYQEDGTEMTADYDYDGYEILTYEKGNRGVRFVFNKVNGSDEMPEYIQFSDHDISSEKAHHYHLYWGDDRSELLEEMEHWPTYYPSELDEAGIVQDMLAH